MGRPVPCPHCSRPVLIVAEGRDELSIRIPEESALAPNGNAGLRNRLAGIGSAVRHATAPVREALASPVGIAWLAASVFTALLIAAVWPRSSVDRVERISPSETVNAPSSKADDARETVDGRGTDDESQSPQDPAGERLQGLRQQVKQFREETGVFPAGTVAEEGLAVPDRFSWLAKLAAAGELSGPPPMWDRSWRDPLNDRFVRRRVPEFLNPQVDQLAGADRYPATHFVGVAGVGEDAADLPAGHPRAGIFGHDRQVKVEDVRDGTSNTMLVAGVDGRLGAWAAGGEPTVRSFNREPYVNGPDGFGGGDGESVPVLMADGSVRRLSPKTDPQVIRRMAAMADGLPLDPSVPGEPGDRLASATSPGAPDAAAPSDSAPERPRAEPPADAAPAPAPVNGPADAEGPVLTQPPPAEPPQDDAVEVPEPPPVNVEAALRVKIVRFSQNRAVPFGRLLNMIEEMAGVPFEWKDELRKQRDSVLKQPTTLELSNTTVGAILERLLGEVGLTYTVGERRIWLHSAGANDGKQQNPPPEEPMPES